jgi:hypothetical protein
MQRALGRAYQRFQGEHPRRPASASGRAMELICDGLLVLAFASLPAGIGVAVSGLIGGVHPTRLAIGGGLVAAGPLLLLAWERLAWEPFAKRLSQLD